VLALALAACGGSSHATRGTAQSRAQCVGSKVAAKRARARAQLNADLARLRVAAATLKRQTEQGNDAINSALDPFMLHVAQETLPVRERSRFIDRAAAIVAPKCYLCFQALEANRPTGATAKLPCD
jgi:hypothetical protein